jgi:hypothetical protein
MDDYAPSRQLRRAVDGSPAELGTDERERVILVPGNDIFLVKAYPGVCGTGSMITTDEWKHWQNGVLFLNGARGPFTSHEILHHIK